MTGARARSCATGGVAALLLALTQAGCVFSAEGPASLPSVANAGATVRGGRIDLVYRGSERRAHIEGELLAVDRGSLVVLTDVPSLIAVPIDRLVSAKLYGWKSQPGKVNAAASLGTLSTLTHGGFLLLTAPMWGLAGAVASSSESSAARLDMGPRDTGRQFRKFARYPGGLPELGQSHLASIPRYGIWDEVLRARVIARRRTQPRAPGQAEPLSASIREQLRRAAACGTGADLPLWCTLADEWPVATRPTLAAPDARHLGLHLVIAPGTTWALAIAEARPVLVALQPGPPPTLRSVLAEDAALGAAVNEALLGAEPDPAVTAWLVAAETSLTSQPASTMSATAAYYVLPRGQLRASREWLYLAERDASGALTLWVLSAAPLP
ncbi:MAG: hypothetical protein IT370_19840 [Deltaproteobacteria bacterium]|nr:hypothetical protein [Deltaproteobacteria bacterium]